MKNLLIATTYVALFLLFQPNPASAQQGLQPYSGQSYPVLPNQILYQPNLAGLKAQHQSQYVQANFYPPPQANSYYYQQQSIPKAAQQKHYYPTNTQAKNLNPGLVANQSQAMSPSPNSYQTTTSSSLSPYEQQEMALKEAKMIRELESMKQSSERQESFRRNDYNPGTGVSSLTERGYAEETGKSGKYKKALNGMGSALKSGARAALPLGTSVGTFFLMRAALGPTTY